MKRFDEKYDEIENEASRNQHKNLFADLKDINTGNYLLILYGTNENCRFAMFTCACYGAKVFCVCDQKVTGIYKYKNRIYDIISPVDLINNYRNAFVLITSWKQEQEIYDSLCFAGFSSSQIYFFRYPQMLTPKVFRENYLIGYREVYDFLTDERSRQRILDKIQLLLIGKPCSQNCSFGEGYFSFPEITLKENEIFADVGAYTGDTIIEFINKTNEKGKNYKHIYSFEADPDNCERAVRNLSGYNNVDFIHCGITSRITEAKFICSQETDGLKSHITSGAPDFIIIPMTSLDLFFYGKPIEQWPTMIKINIEGGEKEALIGAQHIIQAKKPLLMISAYHKPEDIYELPQTILRIRNDYKLTFWQIGTSFLDLILYAF